MMEVLFALNLKNLFALFMLYLGALVGAGVALVYAAVWGNPVEHSTLYLKLLDLEKDPLMALDRTEQPKIQKLFVQGGK